MKILLVSQDGVGSWFTLRLMEEGHKVDYYLLKKQYGSILEGIAPVPILDKPDFSKYDLVVFDLTGRPKLADESYFTTATIGDGSIATLLEEDRLYGIKIMEEAGINVPAYEVFSDIGSAKRFVRKTNKRYVFKPFGDQDTASTYVADSAEDLVEYMDKLSSETKGVEFLLQEVVGGTEVSTEGWFNGEDFFLLNGTLEEKKFMNDGKGPNTGCSGNLVWCYEQHEPWIFREGLGKLRDYLRSVNYRGMIDLNTIVSSNELWGLEWTPRFGYDASSTLQSLITSDLGQFYFDVASGNPSPKYTIGYRFAASVRISIPPYPTEVKGHHPEGVPIKGLTFDDCIRGCYLYDVKEENEDLVSAGHSGFICAPIAVGDSIREAFDVVKMKIDKIKVPNKQYRTDIYTKTFKRYHELQKQGWLR